MAEVGIISTVTNAASAAVDGVKNFGGAVNSIEQPETQAQGEHKSKAKKKYSYEYLTYPGDLGTNSRHPYWMTFYINKQELSHFTKNASSEGIFDKKSGQAIRSTVENNANQGRNLQKNFGGTRIGFGRKTQRTALAIRLFLPETLAWNFSNKFNEAHISDIPLMGLVSTVTSIPALFDSSTEAAKKGGLPGVLASLQSPAARQAVGAGAEFLDEFLGSGNKGLGLSTIGLAINPQVDVIYESPDLRQFNFDFMFSPQSEQDAIAIQKIIKEFKFHSAPEMLAVGSGIGRYYVPPSEFDIQFSVPSLGKISTCVLQNITVDYAPSGTAFYGSGTDTIRPVNTRMTLQFKELEFMTKELIDRGY